MPTQTGGTYYTTTSNGIYQTWINEWEVSQTTATLNTNWTAMVDTSTTATTATVWFAWNEACSITANELDMEHERTVQQARNQLMDVLEHGRMVQARNQLREPHDSHVAAWCRHKSILAGRRADRRALATMLRCLDSYQRGLFREFGYFIVKGGKTGQIYRIRKGSIGNIDVMGKAGMVKQRLCAHPASPMPVYDVMLAQALHLAANEEQFLKKANRHPAPVEQMEFAGTA